MKPALKIRTTFTLHQRIYDKEVHFRRRSFRQGAWEWMYPGLEALAQHSVLSPFPAQTITNQLKGLLILTSLREWADLSVVPAKDAPVEEVVRLFVAFEQALVAGGGTTLKQLSRLSGDTRSGVLKWILGPDASGRTMRVRKLFRSQIIDRPDGRQLISDMPMEGRAPLSALKHSTYVELRQAAKELLTSDLDRIKAACADVLDRYDAALQYLDDLECKSISAEEEKRLRSKYNDESWNRESDPWSEAELGRYLCIRLRQLAGTTAPLEGKNSAADRVRRHPPGAKEYLRSKLHRISNGPHVYDLLQLGVAPSAEVLLACALTIQMHTHWNYISVLELEVEDVDIKQFPHKLQSVKPRTSDNTPLVFVERSDHLVIRALRHLTRRWQLLLTRGVIGKEDTRLWFSSKSVVSGRPSPVVAWGGELRSFTEAYELPPFSLEQVRVQCLATVSLGERGLSGVMQSAGHAEVQTSMRYVDKLLLRGLNAANSFEFEKRLDATIRYMIDPTAPDEDIIAFPVGDGSSCRDPEAPPDPTWLDAGLCRGERCHTGEGCPNRSLLITKERIEEVIRTKSYYSKNWARLADENVVRFEAVQLPQMLFTFALFGALKRGPYRHLVKNDD